MSLNGAIIKDAGTVSVTGGTDQTLTLSGQKVNNGIALTDNSVEDFRVRPTLIVKSRQPVLMDDGTYKKDSKSLSYVEPIITADGQTHFNLITITREIHPETAAQVALDINIRAAQMCFDTDFAAFWAYGSMA